MGKVTAKQQQKTELGFQTKITVNRSRTPRRYDDM